MRYYFLLAVVSLGTTSWSQQTSPSVIASSGNSFQNGAVLIDFTIGEPVTNSNQNGAILLTQGFHQPIISLANVSEWEDSNVQLYPNPTVDKLILQVTENTYQQVQIFDANGKLVFEQSELSKITEIPVINLAKGTYNLILKGGTSKHLSFIKLD